MSPKEIIKDKNSMKVTPFTEITGEFNTPEYEKAVNIIHGMKDRYLSFQNKVISLSIKTEIPVTKLLNLKTPEVLGIKLTNFYEEYKFVEVMKWQYGLFSLTINPKT